MILETAAIALAGERAGTDRIEGVSSHVMFLARGKVGPFRVEGDVQPGADGTIAVRALLHDEGADDRPVTAASHQFRVVADG